MEEGQQPIEDVVMLFVELLEFLHSGGEVEVLLALVLLQG